MTLRKMKPSMKFKTLAPALLASLLLLGCARHYTITLTSGNRITTASKPHLQNGYYVFKDAKGGTNAIAAGRVREIAPSNMASPRLSSGFSAQPEK